MALTTFSPAADVLTQWILFGGGTHASAVLTNDGDTKYIFLVYNILSPPDDDFWTITSDLPIPSGAAITSVISKVVGRCTNTANGNNGGNESRHILRLNGIDYYSMSDTWTSLAYATKTFLWLVHPATGQPWRYTDFNALSGIGARKPFAEAGAGQIRLTRVWLEVTWTLLPLTETEIATFWRLQRLVRRREIDDVSKDAAVVAKWTWYNELRNRANFNGQDLKPPREFTDRDYDAGLFPAKRRFR